MELKPCISGLSGQSFCQIASVLDPARTISRSLKSHDHNEEACRELHALIVIGLSTNSQNSLSVVPLESARAIEYLAIVFTYMVWFEG